jgi:hypothetical protein
MKHMKPGKLIILAAMSALVSFLTVGCAHTLSKTEETKVSSDGTVKTKEKTVTQNADGTVTRTESQKSSSPPRP